MVEGKGSHIRQSGWRGWEIFVPGRRRQANLLPRPRQLLGRDLRIGCVWEGRVVGASGQQDTRNVRAIVGVDDGKRQALRRPCTKLRKGNVAPADSVVEAAS